MDWFNYEIDRDNVRVDDEGRWVTTEQGHHVHISGNGVPDKGNSHVLSRLREVREYGAPLKREIIPPEETRTVRTLEKPTTRPQSNAGPVGEMKSVEERIRAVANQSGSDAVRAVSKALEDAPMGAALTLRRPNGWIFQYVKVGRDKWKSTSRRGRTASVYMLADHWRDGAKFDVRLTEQSEAPSREEIDRINDNVWPDLIKKDSALDDFFNLK